nr:MFS transporter [Nocardioides alcanivorans]
MQPGSRLLLPTLLLLTTVGGIVSGLGASLVPTIARDLDVSLGAAQWSLTATMVTAAVATPVLGRYAVAHRRRPIILSGLAVVAAGTVLAALAIELPALGLPALIAGRSLQGIGMALAPSRWPSPATCFLPNASAPSWRCSRLAWWRAPGWAFH